MVPLALQRVRAAFTPNLCAAKEFGHLQDHAVWRQAGEPQAALHFPQHPALRTSSRVLLHTIKICKLAMVASLKSPSQVGSG